MAENNGNAQSSDDEKKINMTVSISSSTRKEIAAAADKRCMPSSSFIVMVMEQYLSGLLVPITKIKDPEYSERFDSIDEKLSHILDKLNDK